MRWRSIWSTARRAGVGLATRIATLSRPTGALALPRRCAGFVVVLALIACNGDSTGPGQRDYIILVDGGQYQFTTPGTLLSEPFRVVVVDPKMSRLVPGASVEWMIISGPSGGALTTATSTTDSLGVATTRLHPGDDPGTYQVEARVRGGNRPPAVFQAWVVRRPELQSVSPNPVSAGDTIVIAGRDFSTYAPDNEVLLSGMRATVLSGTSTQLTVVVPPCVPERQVEVTVRLGTVTATNSLQLDIEGGTSSPVTLARGAAIRASNTACLSLPGGSVETAYLVIPQNATNIDRQPMPFRLAGHTGGGIAAALDGGSIERYATAGIDPDASVAAWESRLREQEARLLATSPYRPAPATSGAMLAAEVPSPGDRRSFDVLNRSGGFSRITAEVVYVSERAIIYQDIEAPSPGGYTAADFEFFGDLFDDPIHSRLVEVFGEPSDIDGNDGRILILFTPVVNELTPEGADSFVAGFFYGLDLLPSQPNSNAAEIFYSLVPDPEGRHGARRTRSQLLSTVPPVLAHEFLHMIHFNQRNLVRQASGPEELWLSEALAHAAEYLVAAEFQRRGQNTSSRTFRVSNLRRAVRFLEATYEVSLFAPDWLISLETRGAGWLFLHYLAGHYGGDALYGDLVRTTQTGVANITARTQQTWDRLLSDWAVALWATDAPQLTGAQLDPLHRYTNLTLRSELSSFSMNYPLAPANMTPSGAADFVLADTLPSASSRYVVLQSGGAGLLSLHLGFSGPLGSQWFAGTRPQLTVLRYR